MKPGQAIYRCIQKYADFKGRAVRPEYWWFYLFLVILDLAAISLDTSSKLSTFFDLLFFLPTIAAGTRRLHDTNRSGWWQLIAFTLIGIIPLIVWLATRGDAKANRYGPPEPFDLEGSR